MKTPESSAFQATLERVIDEERVALATSVGWVRLVVTVAICTLTLRPLWSGEGVGNLGPTFVTSLVSLAAAIIVVVLLRRGLLDRRAGWVALVVDAPLIATAQLLQTAQLNGLAFGITNTLGLMSGLIGLSALSLDRRVVVGTFLVMLVPLGYRMRLVENVDMYYLLPVFGVAGLTAVLLVLIGRIRGLIRSARSADLMGKYLLGKRVGRGGMAEVFEATYSPEGGFERRVAVKRILPSQLDNTEMVELFRREAELGALLNHPGIVQVLDFGRHEGSWFLAMEFIDGVSLRDLLVDVRTRGVPLPLEVVTHVAAQLAEALDYVHTRAGPDGRPLQLVHRDLNPPNVMLTQAGEVKLADFGIALAVTRERLTATGIMRGKLGYASPEQLVDAPFDGRADLYALGVTLHECLTGVRLFSATSDVELMRMCIEKPVERPSSVRIDVPPELDAIVMGLLERDLERRTPSAATLRRQVLTVPPPLLDVQRARALLVERVALVKASAPPSSPLPVVASPLEQTATVNQPPPAPP